MSGVFLDSEAEAKRSWVVPLRVRKIRGGDCRSVLAEVKRVDAPGITMATNIGLRRAYTVWAFFYDSAVRFLRWSRRRSLALLDFRTGDTVLLVGCGTGADFEFLPRDVEVTAVDLTPAMLRRAASKVEGRHIRLLEMDAMDLRLPDNAFDKTVLHLILAVVPDPVRTLREAERVTKPNGLLVVLDKFWNRPAPPPLPLRMANALLGGYVTAVDRNFHVADLAETPAGDPAGLRRAVPHLSLTEAGYRNGRPRPVGRKLALTFGE